MSKPVFSAAKPAFLVAFNPRVKAMNEGWYLPFCRLPLIPPRSLSPPDGNRPPRPPGGGGGGLVIEIEGLGDGLGEGDPDEVLMPDSPDIDGDGEGL